ncbi:MAG: D-alanyl-D-alanine carboxypeptidase [Candidatus Pacebacteria bacterium]|nr:D-alanyl-D-alanine carboxypeptidase [Candidatus Paceibacterota bacterium]
MNTTAFRAILATALGLGTLSLALAFNTPKEVPRTQSAAAIAAISEPYVEADAAIVYDVRDRKILFQKNATAQMPLASVTKVMTVMVASEVLDPDELVTIPAEALLRDGESGLVAGASWRVRDLVDLVLIVSSNDGAEALKILSEERIASRYARAPQGGAFIWRMNERARELGLEHTYFLDVTGLDPSPTMASSYGTAFDIARMIAAAGLEYEAWFSGTAKDGLLIVPEDTGSITAENTNEALGNISGLIAGKTGYTDLAQGNLAIVFDADLAHPIAVVVLHSSKDGRFTDVERLVEFVRSNAQ